MSIEITEGVLEAIVNNIGSLMLEQKEGINHSFHTIDSLKLSIGVVLDVADAGVSVECVLSFPLEPKPNPIQKQTVRLRQIINEDQGRLI